MDFPPAESAACRRLVDWALEEDIGPIGDLTSRALIPDDRQGRAAFVARADGVVVFERPAIKQSTERLFLQIADSAAIDQPALAPINFRQTTLMENDHE